MAKKKCNPAMRDGLKALRSRREGLTQKDVADALGIEKDTYAKYEQGERTTIEPEMIPKLALVFGCSVTEVLTAMTTGTLQTLGQEVAETTEDVAYATPTVPTYAEACHRACKTGLDVVRNVFATSKFVISAETLAQIATLYEEENLSESERKVYTAEDIVEAGICNEKNDLVFSPRIELGMKYFVVQYRNGAPLDTLRISCSDKDGIVSLSYDDEAGPEHLLAVVAGNGLNEAMWARSKLNRIRKIRDDFDFEGCNRCSKVKVTFLFQTEEQIRSTVIPETVVPDAIFAYPSANGEFVDVKATDAVANSLMNATSSGANDVEALLRRRAEVRASWAKLDAKNGKQLAVAKVAIQKGYSFISIDKDGEVFRYMAKLAADEGYTVKLLDFRRASYPSRCDAWNFLQDILLSCNTFDRDSAVLSFADFFLASTIQPINTGNQAVAAAERCLLTATLTYIFYEAPRDKVTLEFLTNLLDVDDDFLGTMMEDSVSDMPRRMWRAYMIASQDVRDGAKVCLMNRLIPFMTEATSKVINTTDISVADVFEKRCAFFIVCDSDNPVSSFETKLFLSTINQTYSNYDASRDTPKQRIAILAKEQPNSLFDGGQDCFTSICQKHSGSLGMLHQSLYLEDDDTFSTLLDWSEAIFPCDTSPADCEAYSTGYETEWYRNLIQETRRAELSGIDHTKDRTEEDSSGGASVQVANQCSSSLGRI